MSFRVVRGLNKMAEARINAGEIRRVGKVRTPLGNGMIT